jgi:hypothetical protein
MSFLLKAITLTETLDPASLCFSTVILLFKYVVPSSKQTATRFSEQKQSFLLLLKLTRVVVVEFVTAFSLVGNNRKNVISRLDI